MIIRIAIIVFVFYYPSSCRGAEEVDHAIETISQRWNKVRSAMFCFSIRRESQRDETISIGTDEQAVILERKDERLLYRSELSYSIEYKTTTDTSTSHPPVAGVPEDGVHRGSQCKIATRDSIFSLVVADGETRALQYERGTDPELKFGGAELIRNLKKNATLKLLDDEIVAERTAFKIERRSIMPDGKVDETAVYTYWIDKATGLLLKWEWNVEKSKARKTKVIALIKDLQFDKEIDESKFKFSAPPGVTVEKVQLENENEK